MLRLNRLQQLLKPYGLQIENTGQGKHPFKVKGFVFGTQRYYSYPLKVHGRNPEISESYLKGIIDKFKLPDDVFKM
jgi:hypothetical protein